MESLPKCILKYNDNTLQEVRKAVNLAKPGEMTQAIDILEDWIKQQNHFTRKDFDRRYLENMMITNKGSIERAKNRLDRACTLRTMMPSIFVESDIRRETAEHLKDIYLVNLPRMTKDHCRVYVMLNKGKGFSPNMMESLTKYAAVFCEYVRKYDYSTSNYLIVDNMDCNLSDFALNFSVNELRQFASLLLDCHGLRVKGIHVLSNSSLIGMIVQVVKQVVTAKIADRIHVHKDLESIHKIIDKDILPIEYGGKEKPVVELFDELIDELTSKDHQKYCRDVFLARTDESKRQTDKFNEQYLGMPGSFRTLKVD